MATKRVRAREQMSGITYHNIWWVSDATVNVPNDILEDKKIWLQHRRLIRDALKSLLSREYWKHIDNQKLSGFCDEAWRIRVEDLATQSISFSAITVWEDKKHCASRGLGEEHAAPYEIELKKQEEA